MPISLAEFADKIKARAYDLMGSKDHLPCFAHRRPTISRINTDKLITEYIKVCAAYDENDVLVFSVTEREFHWKAWKDYAKAHPRTFKVVEGGSIHGKYLCRMYIYTKPAKQRKFHTDNIAQFRPR